MAVFRQFLVIFVILGTILGVILLIFHHISRHFDHLNFKILISNSFQCNQRSKTTSSRHFQPYFGHLRGSFCRLCVQKTCIWCTQRYFLASFVHSDISSVNNNFFVHSDIISFFRFFYCTALSFSNTDEKSSK